MQRTATPAPDSSPLPQPPSAPLQIGDAAPDFCLRGDDDREHRLADFVGKKVVLYFYPKDNTPGCTTEACDFRDQDPAFTASGAVIIGVSPDSVRTHQGFKGKHALPFLLLSDPGNVVAQRYGAFGEKVLYGRRSQGVIRSTFVIDLTQGSARLSALYRKVAVKGHASAVLEAVGTGKGAAPR